MSDQPGHEGTGPTGPGPDGTPPPVPPPGAPQADQYGQYGQYGQASQYGQYGQYGQASQYGQYGAQPGPPPPPGPAPDGAQYGQYGPATGGGYYGGGFVPVPTAVQPGIIPLRPLSLGEIYDGAFRAIRTNPKVMFGLAVLVIGIAAVLQTVFTTIFYADLEQALLGGTFDADFAVSVFPLVGIVVTSLGSGLAALVLEGLAIVSVSESVIGRTITIRQVWQRAKGRLWRLLGLSVVLWFAAVVGMIALLLIMGVVFAGLAQVAGDGGLVALVILIPLVLLGVAVLFLFFAVRLMLATCAVMLEGTGVFASIARSWRMTQGHFWRLLGIMLLTAIIVSILSAVLSVPFTMVGSFVAMESLAVSVILGSLGQLAGSALAIPVLAAVLALLYIDVRMRSEGLDVELARAAQGP